MVFGGGEGSGLALTIFSKGIWKGAYTLGGKVEPSLSSSYNLNCTTSALLDGWPWQWIT